MFFLSSRQVSPSISFGEAGAVSEGSSWGPVIVLGLHLTVIFFKVSSTSQRPELYVLSLYFVLSKAHSHLLLSLCESSWGGHGNLPFVDEETEAHGL